MLNDANGTPIVIGATAVVLKAGLCKGQVGTVHAIKDAEIRVGAGDPDKGPYFSTWCQPKQISVVSAAASVTHGDVAGKQ